MSEPMTLREEQETAIREAAAKIASRIDHVFSFDDKKLEEFRSNKERRGYQQAASQSL